MHPLIHIERSGSVASEAEADRDVSPECRAPKLHGRSHARLFDDGGFFAGANVVWKTKRYAASLVMAVSDQDFELEIDGHTQRLGFAAVRPFVTSQINAQNVPFVCLDLSPDHPDYHAFTGIGESGFMAFPRERFAGVADLLREFHAGGMRGDASFRLFRRLVNLTLTLLPPANAPDLRAVQAQLALSQNPALTAQELASACALSHRQLSHLFSQEMGMTLRQYAQWLKIKAALSLVGSGFSLTTIATAAGFADAAHFCKVWAQTYGAPPAYFFYNDEVDILPRRHSPRFNAPNVENNPGALPIAKA
jgi:AraC-like DNA-binding protein